MKGFKALRLSPQSPPSHPPPGCLSLAQGAYPCSAAPPEGEGPLPSGRGWWHCRVVLWRVRAARVQCRVPMPTCRPLRKERVPPSGGGMAGMWAGPVAGKSISLRPPHPGARSPPQTRGSIYCARAGAACPSRAPPGPRFGAGFMGGSRWSWPRVPLAGSGTGWVALGWGRAPLV